MANILIVDDEIGIRELLSEILRDEGHDILLAENAARARAIRQETRPDLVLLDIWMPDTDGITLLKEWTTSGLLTMPVIMMSGHGTIDTAVEATRIGAIDYLEKPIALQKLLNAVKGALQRPTSTGTNTILTLSLFPRSSTLRDLHRRLQQIAEKSRTLLLHTGIGSIAELAARSVPATQDHWLDLSSVAQPLNLQQLQACQGGILYVPELSRLSRLQQKNLSFAMERLERFNQHLVVVTTQDRSVLLEAGWDSVLISQIFEVSFTPPSMADIQDDIPELANQLLQHYIKSDQVPPRKLSTAAQNALRTQGWPGGFEQLRAAIKSLALSTLEEEISLADVRRILPPGEDSAGLTISLDQPLREAREAFERLYFEHHLRTEGSNMTRIAEKRGLERTHLYRKIKQLNLQSSRRSED